MDQVDIDIIGIERLEALLNRIHHALARAVAVVRLTRVSDPELGRDHSILAPRSKRLGQRFLRRTHAIGLGGIEAVKSYVQRPIDCFDELGFFDAPVTTADFPAAKTYRGDIDAGLTERTIFHVLCLLVSARPGVPA